MRTEELILEYQNVIPAAPYSNEQLFQQACGNDKVTVNTWRPVWLGQTKANKEAVGTFSDKGIGKLWGKFQYKPCIIAGSGPSLKRNAKELLNKGDIPLVSCLHNFHYLEDLGVKVDYYVSLDAGIATVEDLTQGGSKSEQEYWNLTKDRTLLAYIGSHPELIKRWQGEVLFFNVPVPDQSLIEEMKQIEQFNTCIGTGGNVLGACLYISKAILGANPIVFVGADFCFGSGKSEAGEAKFNFHPWNDERVDKNIGQFVYVTDIFGIKRKTWQSYYNFKCWFDHIAQLVPGIYYNCSEGGALGSYPEGNISAFKYMDLAQFFDMAHLNRHKKAQCEDPTGDHRTILF